MVLLESNPFRDQQYPDFSLETADQRRFSLTGLMKSNGAVLVFTCNHCPYALAIWERLVNLYTTLKSLDIECIAINPNFHPDYPEDSAENMLKLIQQFQIPFPYLCDQDQSVAKAYGAVCTPDIFYLNQNRELIYHGRLDDNWKNPQAVSTEELLVAIQRYVQTQQITHPQHPSMGCSIKWQ